MFLIFIPVVVVIDLAGVEPLSIKASVLVSLCELDNTSVTVLVSSISIEGFVMRIGLRDGFLALAWYH